MTKKYDIEHCLFCKTKLKEKHDLYRSCEVDEKICNSQYVIFYDFSENYLLQQCHFHFTFANKHMQYKAVYKLNNDKITLNVNLNLAFQASFSSWDKILSPQRLADKLSKLISFT